MTQQNKSTENWEEELNKIAATYPDMKVNDARVKSVFFDALSQRDDELMKEIDEYLQHKSECINNQLEAGEPTPDGGYRQKFAGKWYQSSPTDETPKCNCGLDKIINLIKERSK